MKKKKLDDTTGILNDAHFDNLSRISGFMKMALRDITDRLVAPESAMEELPILIPKELVSGGAADAKRVIAQYEPERVIPRPGSDHYLSRYYLWAPTQDTIEGDEFDVSARSYGTYLHHFTDTYDAEMPHCHPWPSLALQLSGTIEERVFNDKDIRSISQWEYEEVTISGHAAPDYYDRVVEPGMFSFRPPNCVHSITKTTGTPITIFVTGKWLRPWFFYPKENLYQPIIHTIWRRLLMAEKAAKK